MQKRGFLPESQNDMIFSIICEELGLFGAIAVIFLFIVWQVVRRPNLLLIILLIGIYFFS